MSIPLPDKGLLEYQNAGDARRKVAGEGRVSKNPHTVWDFGAGLVYTEARREFLRRHEGKAKYIGKVSVLSAYLMLGKRMSVAGDIM